MGHSNLQALQALVTKTEVQSGAMSFIDLVIASARDTHGSEWNLDQIKAAYDTLGRLIDEFAKANPDLQGLDVLGELSDEIADQCDRCAPYEPTSEDLFNDRQQAAYEQRVGV